MENILQQLKAPFDTSLISWRVGATSGDKKSGIALAYIDARDVMNRLDEVIGPDKWQCKYESVNETMICSVGIYILERQEWVWKSNGAGETSIEAEKGACSDSFKRAAVLWGVGRYLYDMKNVWVDLVPAGKSYRIKNPNDPRLAQALNEASGIKVEPPSQSKSKPENRSQSTVLNNAANNLDPVQGVPKIKPKQDNETGVPEEYARFRGMKIYQIKGEIFKCQTPEDVEQVIFGYFAANDNVSDEDATSLENLKNVRIRGLTNG